MATVVLNKRKFIEWLEKQLTDDQVILMTQDIAGQLKYVKKRNETQIPFAFAADCWKHQNGVGHIAYGKTPVVAFGVSEKNEVSEETLKMFNQQNS